MKTNAYRHYGVRKAAVQRLLDHRDAKSTTRGGQPSFVAGSPQARECDSVGGGWRWYGEAARPQPRDVMSALTRRREPRIHYRAGVRIKDPRVAQAIEATGLDLSRSGMRVRMRAVCSVGSNVVCELDVQGQQLALPGVVAWTDPPAPDETSAARERHATQTLFRLGGEAQEPQEPTRSERPDTQVLIRLGGDAPKVQAASVEESAPDAAMGIRFDALAVEHTRALDDLLSQGEPLTSRVQLWFSGLADPVEARAQASKEGILLNAALPFLALDSKVRFRFTSSDEEHRGRVRRVELTTVSADRIPRLDVEVALQAASNSEPPAAPVTTADERSKTRGLAARIALLLLTFALGLGLGAAAAWLWLARSAPQRPALARARPAVAPLPATSIAFSVPAAPIAMTPLEQKPAEKPEDPGLTAAFAQAETAPPIPAPEPDPPALTTPEVSTLDEGTRIFVPMEGKGVGMSAYTLSSPGIVVNLPQAHARIPLLDYPVYQGLVRRVWLRARGDGGVQVRVVWRRPLVRYKLAFDDQGLTISARP